MAADNQGHNQFGTEAHRLDGFIDAAFAFAVSVMAIAGTDVPRSLHDLLMDLDRVPGFACSFATLMIFWHRQVRWRQRFHFYDTTTTAVSLMLVFVALIFVYPLNMLFQALFSSIYEAFAHAAMPNEPAIGSIVELRDLYLCYALAYICMAVCLAWLYGHSLRHTPPRNAVDQVSCRRTYYVQWGSVLVGLLSMLVALLLPRMSAWAWLPGVVYMLQILVNRFCARWAARQLMHSA